MMQLRVHIDHSCLFKTWGSEFHNQITFHLHAAGLVNHHGAFTGGFRHVQFAKLRLTLQLHIKHIFARTRHRQGEP